MYPPCSSCAAAEGASGCFLVLWFCSDTTQIVVTRPANSNCLLVTQYMLFESVRFFLGWLFSPHYAVVSVVLRTAAHHTGLMHCIFVDWLLVIASSWAMLFKR
jgi:hypothetical protein